MNWGIFSNLLCKLARPTQQERSYRKRKDVGGGKKIVKLTCLNFFFVSRRGKGEKWEKTGTGMKICRQST